MCVLIVYTVSFCLIKSSYTERKQMQKTFVKQVDFWYFLRCLSQFCYKTQSQFLSRDLFLWNTKEKSVTTTPEIRFVKIKRQILWLLHQRFICLIWSCILPSLVKKLNFLYKILCSINCVSLKSTFWQYLIIPGLDKYNVSK